MNNNITNDKLKSGIYQIRNRVNNKVYVGQTKNFSTRKRVHFRSLEESKHYNNYLQRSFNKYGMKNFAFEILEFCPEEHLNTKERYWIEKKQSEYSGKGYNAAYAVTLFNKYDSVKKINKTKRKPNVVVFTDEMRKKMSERARRFFSVEENRIALSISRSEISIDTVERIKLLLSQNLEITCRQVAEKLNVNFNSVTHIQNLNSHTYVLKELNYIISNRNIILDKRKNKKIMHMYRGGHSYKEIGESIGIHQRNVIRRVNEIKTIHDDRCRLNCINKSIIKRDSLIRTLYSMGKNTVEISKTLKVSRCTIRKTLDNPSELFDDVNKTRGKVNNNKYKTNKADLYPIINDGIQLAFVI